VYQAALQTSRSWSVARDCSASPRNYNYKRYYQPKTGRYLGVDPLRPLGLGNARLDMQVGVERTPRANAFWSQIDGFHPSAFSSGLYAQKTSLARIGDRKRGAEIRTWGAKDPITFEDGATNPYVYCANHSANCIDPTGLWTFAIRADWTFGAANVTWSLVFDGEGNVAVQITPAAGLSPSIGTTIGITSTDAPDICSLEGAGHVFGATVNLLGTGLGAEANYVRAGAYEGFDVGIGASLGAPIGPQGFVGQTKTLYQMNIFEQLE